MEDADSGRLRTENKLGTLLSGSCWPRLPVGLEDAGSEETQLTQGLESRPGCSSQPTAVPHFSPAQASGWVLAVVTESGSPCVRPLVGMCRPWWTLLSQTG